MDVNTPDVMAMKREAAERLGREARHRAQSHTARRMCGTLTARVWGGRV